jgi:V8-like Glu-specific endopeptidase
MRPRHRTAPRRTAPHSIVGLTVAACLVAAGTAALTEAALAKDQATAGRAPASQAVRAIGTVQVIGTAAQAAARTYWTPARMADATIAGPGSAAGTGSAADAGSAASATSAASAAGAGRAVGPEGAAAPAEQRQDAVMGAAAPQEPPRGTPNSQYFTGVPTVGALFYTKANSNHFCTASVIDSAVGSLVLTAAHCVYSSSGYSQNLEFIPGYAGGSSPYGVWPVTQITVAKGWRQGQNPDLDVAFLNVVPPQNSVGPIDQVTGALHIAFALPDAQHITVIGYNNTDQKPIICTTTSFKFRTDQMEFYCRGFWYGTSGGPWILDYNAGSGTGTVYGVIGGYEAGGDVTWASYAAALEKPAQELLTQAEASASSTTSSTGKSSTDTSSTGKSSTDTSSTGKSSTASSATQVKASAG